MRYYTYTHSTPDGSVFYVGKGTKQRAYSMSDRTVKWKEIRNKFDGLNIKIVEYFDDENDAYIAEELLIKHYKELGNELVNYTSGGRGVKDYVQSEEARKHKSDMLKGYKHDIIVCPHCGEEGGATSMKRWHFDNCTGKRPKYQSRVTVLGKRVYLGKYNTKDEADEVASEFKEFVLQELNNEYS